LPLTVPEICQLAAALAILVASLGKAVADVIRASRRR